MKNFLDCNFTAGFAYKYDTNGKQKWLLTGKTSRILTTSWAPSFIYTIFPVKLSWNWKIMRLGFCWIKTKSVTIFGNMDDSKTDKNRYLASLSKLV
jgi:putative NADPH-quinone reductase